VQNRSYSGCWTQAWHTENKSRSWGRGAQTPMLVYGRKSQSREVCLIKESSNQATLLGKDKIGGKKIQRENSHIWTSENQAKMKNMAIARNPGTSEEVGTKARAPMTKTRPGQPDDMYGRGGAYRLLANVEVADTLPMGNAGRWW